jgi:hypothetical protein
MKLKSVLYHFICMKGMRGHIVQNVTQGPEVDWTTFITNCN